VLVHLDSDLLFFLFRDNTVVAYSKNITFSKHHPPKSYQLRIAHHGRYGGIHLPR
jgi:hypothetical protein